MTDNWDAATGHRTPKIDPVPVRAAVQRALTLVQAKVFDDAVRDELLDALHAIDVATA